VVARETGLRADDDAATRHGAGGNAVEIVLGGQQVGVAWRQVLLATTAACVHHRDLSAAAGARQQVSSAPARMNGARTTEERRMNLGGARRIRPSRVSHHPYNSSRMPKVLVVEDEPSLVEALEFGLAEEGFEVVSANDGEASLAVFERERPDIVLLDLMLPTLSGTEVCKRIRSHSKTPIIMLTARDSEIDKVVGLEVGADDYVTKPFSMRELLARVKAVLRRSGEDHAHDGTRVVEVSGVRVDPERYEVSVRGQTAELPPKEFSLLEVLVRNAGRVLTRELLIDRIWGADYVGDTKTLDVHIKRLRGKVEQDPHDPQLIQTVRGVGYKFRDD
jgi:two-component system response regulator RegX3